MDEIIGTHEPEKLGHFWMMSAIEPIQTAIRQGRPSGNLTYRPGQSPVSRTLKIIMFVLELDVPWLPQLLFLTSRR